MWGKSADKIRGKNQYIQEKEIKAEKKGKSKKIKINKHIKEKSEKKKYDN